MKKRELSQLEENFRSYIQPFLSGKEQEDYDLVWGWEKFIFEKSERVKSEAPGPIDPVSVR